MAKLVIAWIKANWFMVGAWLFRGVDWAGVVARVFSYLLRRAVNSGSYAQVRLVAVRIVEQAQHVLAITEDGEITAAEAAAGVDAVRRLLDAWADGKCWNETRPIEAEIQKAVEVLHGRLGKLGKAGRIKKPGRPGKIGKVGKIKPVGGVPTGAKNEEKPNEEVAQDEEGD